MMENYETFCWLFIGAYLGLKQVPACSPWVGYVAGAMIFVLSLIRLVG